MTIRLITGIPGSGKTLYAVSELKKIVEQNLTADEPRKIYCDITGLKITGIEPPPKDWRLTPPNSLLIYDEAQFHDEFKPSRGQSQYKQIEDLTIHRKTGHEIWFITQDPKRLHNDILAMVEQHHHLDRPYGAKLASIYKYRGAEKNPNSIAAKGRVENKQLFAYDKSLYEIYESSQVNDGIKFRLPKELTFWLVVLCLSTYACYHFIFAEGTQEYLNMAKGNQQQPSDPQESNKQPVSTTPMPQEPPSPQEPLTPSSPTPEQLEANRRLYVMQRREELYNRWLPKDYEIIKSDDNLQVRAVISSKHGCKAYNTYGDLMTLTNDECKYYIAETGRVHKPRAGQQSIDMPIQTAQTGVISDDNKTETINQSTQYHIIESDNPPPIRPTHTVDGNSFNLPGSQQ